MSSATSGTVSWIDGRWIESLECVVSVLLAIVLGHLLAVGNISWAAFSGYMVMRGHFLDTLGRGFWRIVGSSAGGLLALLSASAVTSSTLAAAVLLGAVGLITLYAALTTRRAYAWLFVGLTFAMVVLDKLEHPDISITAFVETRILEVTIGTVACVLVSTISAFTLRRWPGQRSPVVTGRGWDPVSFTHAAQGALALAVLPCLGAVAPLRELSQGAVTIMAVMLVPVPASGGSAFGTVSRKLLHRVVGCISGIGFAAFFLVLGHGLHSADAMAIMMLLGTAAGVGVGRRIETSGHSMAYVGTQFVLAILVALVPDNYSGAEIGPSLERLTGILAGMIVLGPILLLWYAITRSRGDRGQLEP
jgi:uncharacterized membrane protein YccC